MLWTQEKIERAKEILGTCAKLDHAYAKLDKAFGQHISTSSLRNAFHSRNELSPTWHLKNNPKAKISIKWTPELVQRFNDMTPLRSKEKATSPLRVVRGKVSRILVVSDLHVPYHDVRAWECVLEVIRKTKPETIVVIGDFLDAYAISSHPKSLDRKADFSGEISAANTELDRLQKAACSARIVYCAGNHEDRVERYLQSKAPELAGFAGMRSDGLLRIKERGIEWVPYRRHIKIGNCAFTHDVGRCGINAARQSLLDFGGNIVFGHSHRGALVFQGEAKGSSHFGLNVGWLGDVDGVDYQHRIRCLRDWQTGFGIVDQDETGYSWGQFVPVIGGKCVVDGQAYGERMAA